MSQSSKESDLFLSTTADVLEARQPWDRSAWKELGIKRLGLDVFRLPLPVPWAEVGVVNCYLLIGDDKVVLIDPGWSTPESRKTLDSYMAALGLSYTDVAGIVATHHHADHVTQAFDLRREYNIPLYLGQGEYASLEAAVNEEGYWAQVARIASFGAVDLAEESRIYRDAGPEATLPRGMADYWIDDDGIISSLPIAVRAVSTPGHTQGHISLQLDRRIFISGDHLLPLIGTSSGIERVPEEYPLRSYIGSLRKVLGLQDSRLLPAHGHSGETIHRRATKMLDYHEDRLSYLGELVEQPVSGYELALGMSWTKKNLPFTSLPMMRQVTAVLDIGFHLDELARRGDLRVSIGRDGIRRYRRPTPFIV